jgi:outer membrane biogenesis lipoprotein LolB
MKTNILTLLVGTAAALLAGCVATTPHYDAHFGESVLKLQAQQTANPTASLTAHPDNGLDAKTAKSAIVNYNNNGRAPASTTGALTTSSGTGGN